MSPNAQPAVVAEKTRLLREHKHSRPLTACWWDPLNRFVFFGAEDNQVHRLDLTSGSAVPLTGHDSWVRALGSSADGQVLYSGGYDGRLIWWPAAAEKPEPQRTVDAHQGWIRALAVSPDGKIIATCGNDLQIRLWDAQEGMLLRSLSGHASHVYNVVFAPDGRTLYSCDLKGQVKSWDPATGTAHPDPARATALHKYDETFRADIGGARSIAIDDSGRQLALGGITNVSNAFAGVGEVAVVLLDLTTGQVARLLETKAKTRGTTWGVAWHPSGFWVGLSGGGGGYLHFWKGDTQHEFFSLKLKNDGRGMAISPDRSQLAVAHADSHLRTYAMFEG